MRFIFIAILGINLIIQMAQIAQAEILDYIVAVVNDDVITFSGLQREKSLLADKLATQGIALPQGLDFERQVLERMIFKTLQLQLAQQTGVIIDDNSLNETVLRIAEQNGMDLLNFQRTIEEDGNYSFAQFREELREEMLIGRLRQRQVTSKINVTQSEINNFLANQLQQGAVQDEFRLYHILLVLTESDTTAKINAKRAKAQEIIRNLQAGGSFPALAVQYSDSITATDGGDLGWRRAGEIPAIFVHTVSKMQIGEFSEILQDSNGLHIVYLADKRGSEQFLIAQSKLRHILLETNEVITDFEAQQRLSNLRQQILVQRADFAELARRHSNDGISASLGGDLGWKNAGDFPPELEEIINELNIGEISQPVRSRFGWHLIQVQDRRERDHTEAAVRNRVLQQIRKRKEEESLQLWLRQLRDEAYVEIRTAS